MDIGPFEDWLLSLAAVSRLNIEIWHTGGPAFFSSPVSEEFMVFKEASHFASQVMTRAEFQYAVFQNRHEAFGVPFRDQQRQIGALIAYCENGDRRTAASSCDSANPVGVREMEIFLKRLAALMEDKWAAENEIHGLTTELNNTFEDVYLYSRIASQFATIEFPSSRQTVLAKEIMETMRMDLAFIHLPDRRENNVVIVNEDKSHGIDEKEGFVNQLLNTIPSTAPNLEENYILVNNSKETFKYQGLHAEAFRFLAVEIKHRDNFYGWLGLVSFNLNEIFRRSELRLLISIAEQIALVISSTDLYQNLERFLFNMVRSLIYAIEAKDEYTRGHSERVSSYCRLMAERIGLDEKQKKTLQLASILHDVGKIGIPETILCKPDRLTDEEYFIIQEHPEKGFNILKPLEQLSDALPGILHHHEHYDGNGYPAGLKGEEIPQAARMIAVADTYDAITTDRAYRVAKKPAEALAILEAVKGTQLDPFLVGIFKEVIRSHLRPEKEAGYDGTT
jgi:HD-GYP domain-containing protein (c-di-GMP phosphodiesterase class II)